MSDEQIFPDSEIEEQFFDSLEKERIIPRYRFTPIMDGNIHRFSVKGDYSSETAGAYKIYPWGKRPCWYIRDFRQHNEMIKVLFDRDLSSISRERRESASRDYDSQEAIAARKAHRERERKREEAELRAAYKLACEEYNYSSFASALYHPYVQHKLRLNIPEIGIVLHLEVFSSLFEWNYNNYPEFPSVSRCFELGVFWGSPIQGGRCKDGDLLIPLVDAETGKFMTLQIISSTPDEKTGKYIKRFYRGLPKKNACYRFFPTGWKQSSFIYLVEGFFTGYAVLLLTNLSSAVYCSMGAGNLEHVARSLRKIYPDKKIILMADDDKGTELKLAQKGVANQNSGRETARKLLEAGLVDSVRTPRIHSKNNVNVDWYDVLAERQRNRAIQLGLKPRTHGGIYE